MKSTTREVLRQVERWYMETTAEGKGFQDREMSHELLIDRFLGQI